MLIKTLKILQTLCAVYGWEVVNNIAGKNINNLRHAYDTTLMAESEEELKSLLMKVKEESWLKTEIEKVCLKLKKKKLA